MTEAVSYRVEDAAGQSLEKDVDYALFNEVATPLSTSVLILPPFVDDAAPAAPGEFRIVVDIAVRVRLRWIGS